MAAEALTWRTSPPDAAGFWWCHASGEAASIHAVLRERDGWYIDPIGYVDKWPFTEPGVFLWAGPIVPPPLPVEKPK